MKGNEHCQEKHRLLEKIDAKTAGVASLEAQKDRFRLPVSDLAANLEYAGQTVADDRYGYWDYTGVWDENGKFHIFMSRVPEDIFFFPGWKTASEIVHFVGDGPEGPFTEVGTPFGPDTLPDGQMAAYNPRIHKINGQYVLLYVVRYNYTGETTEGQGYQKICMAITDDLPTDPGSDTLDRWELVNGNGVILEYGIKACNPDLLYVPGTGGTPEEYVLCFKGNSIPTEETGLYYLFCAVSDKLRGPYTILDRRFTDAETAIEDPFLFRWKNKYFLLTYDLAQGVAGAGQSVGLLIPSRDPHFFSMADARIAQGILSDYVKIPEDAVGAYSNTMRFERPCYVFEKGRPAWFVGANALNLDGLTARGNRVVRSYRMEVGMLPRHRIVVDPGLTGGAIFPVGSVTEAEEFDDIFFTVQPEAGFRLIGDSVKVLASDALGRRFPLRVETIGNFLCFLMPAGDAVLTAQFEKIPQEGTGL